MSESARIMTLKEATDVYGQLLGPQQCALLGGCFDLFHYGHLCFLRYARTLSRKTVVLLESDEHIRQRKHKEPFHTQQQRSDILAACRWVDEVILLPFFERPDNEYADAVQMIRPVVIVATEGDPKLGRKQRQAELVGARIELFPRVHGYSSSRIVSYASISGDSIAA